MELSENRRITTVGRKWVDVCGCCYVTSGCEGVNLLVCAFGDILQVCKCEHVVLMYESDFELCSENIILYIIIIN